MRITNKFNLPSGFVNIAKQQHESKPNNYSVTTILSSTRQILLARRNDDKIEQDVSDMVNMIFGTAIHHVLEMSDKKNTTEQRLTWPVQGKYELSGQFDLYNEKTFTIEDYKSSSVWKIKHNDFDDWRKQGLMYAWLAIKNGIIVEHLKFHALLKDWKASGAKYDKNYPPRQVYTWEYDIISSDLREIEKFIKARFKEIIEYEDKELLPLCTEEERWRTPTVFALMKEGRKSAVKLYDNKQDVPEYKEPYYLEVREGEDKKCNKYCRANIFCDYWRHKKGLI